MPTMHDLYAAPADQLAGYGIPATVTYTPGRGFHLAFGDGYQLQHPDETDDGHGWDLWQNGERLLIGVTAAVVRFWLGYLAGVRVTPAISDSRQVADIWRTLPTVEVAA